MPDSIPSSLSELTGTIDEVWAELQAFLGALTEKDTTRRDDNGWTVKDHTTHIAVWEDSVAILFRGGRRHEALGLDHALYKVATFDQINASIMERYRHLPLREAITWLAQVHHTLMLEVRRLSDVQLATAVRDFFPQAPREDDRTMGALIYWNTADHFREHLTWMKNLTAGVT